MYAAALKRISPDLPDIAPSGAPDPLNASVPLPYHHVLFPYGFPVQIKSNEPGIIRAAEQSWAAFPPRFRETPLQIRLLVSGPRATRRPPLPVLSAQANLLAIVADSRNFACCDLSSGFGFASLSKAALVHRDYLRHHFLESMVYSLLDAQHLVKVPAACVARNGCGVLLMGGSGAGKSSLAYACARRGWTYISDDGASLVRRRPGRQVLGNPQTFHFQPGVTALFPGLRGRAKLRDGKPTIEVRTEALPHLLTATGCTVDAIVFLDRRDQPAGPARLIPLSEEECLRALFHSPWPSELPIHHERLAAVERLLQARLYRMAYCDLDPAIDLLEQTIR